MSTAMTNTKGLVLPVYDPGKTTVIMFWVQFRAFMTVKKLQRFLKVTKDPHLPETAETVLDLSDTEGLKAVEQHSEFLAYVAYALAHEDVQGLMIRTMTPEWPDGEAHEVMNGFMSMYFPNDRVSTADLMTELMAIKKLGMYDDPSKLFTQVARCENMAPKVKLPEEFITALIQKKLDKVYLQTLNALAERHEMDGTTLTRMLLFQGVNKFYRMLTMTRSEDERESKKINEESDDDEDNEVSLSTFGGKCWNCSKPGHRAQDCPTPNNGNVSGGNGYGQQWQNRFQESCVHCHKKGHKAENCWLLQSNASKRPSYWRHPGENGSIELSSAALSDCILCAPERIPKELIGDENLMVLDTAATSNIVNSKKGAVEIRRLEKRSIMANQTIMKTSEVGDFHLAFSSKDDGKVVTAIVKDATIAPGGVNLLAASRLTRRGWVLGNDRKAMWLTSPDKKITLMFDIMLPMADGGGAVFCARIKPLSNATGCEVAALATVPEQILHNKLEHCSEKAEPDEVESKPGSRGECGSCAIEKENEKNEPKATVSEQRDAETSKQKSSMVAPACVEKWAQLRLAADKVRMDNDKEDKELVTRIQREEWQRKVFPCATTTTKGQDGLLEVERNEVACYLRNGGVAGAVISKKERTEMVFDRGKGASQSKTSL